MACQKCVTNRSASKGKSRGEGVGRFLSIVVLLAPTTSLGCAQRIPTTKYPSSPPEGTVLAAYRYGRCPPKLGDPYYPWGRRIYADHRIVVVEFEGKRVLYGFNGETWDRVTNRWTTSAGNEVFYRHEHQRHRLTTGAMIVLRPDSTGGLVYSVLNRGWRAPRWVDGHFAPHRRADVQLSGCLVAEPE